MIDSDPKAWSAQKSRQRAVTSFVQLFGGSMSYNYIPRHTDEEYKKYAPNEYKRAGIVLNVAVFFIAVFLTLLAYVVTLLITQTAQITFPRGSHGVYCFSLQWA